MPVEVETRVSPKFIQQEDSYQQVLRRVGAWWKPLDNCYSVNSADLMRRFNPGPRLTSPFKLIEPFVWCRWFVDSPPDLSNAHQPVPRLKDLPLEKYIGTHLALAFCAPAGFTRPLSDGFADSALAFVGKQFLGAWKMPVRGIPGREQTYQKSWQRTGDIAPLLVCEVKPLHVGPKPEHARAGSGWEKPWTEGAQRKVRRYSWESDELIATKPANPKLVAESKRPAIVWQVPPTYNTQAAIDAGFPVQHLEPKWCEVWTTPLRSMLVPKTVWTKTKLWPYGRIENDGLRLQPYQFFWGNPDWLLSPHRESDVLTPCPESDLFVEAASLAPWADREAEDVERETMRQDWAEEEERERALSAEQPSDRLNTAEPKPEEPETMRRIAHLTPDEVEVMTLQRQGLSLDEIAEQMTVSRRTVAGRLKSAKAKLWPVSH